MGNRGVPATRETIIQIPTLRDLSSCIGINEDSSRDNMMIKAGCYTSGRESNMRIAGLLQNVDGNDYPCTLKSLICRSLSGRSATKQGRILPRITA